MLVVILYREVVKRLY